VIGAAGAIAEDAAPVLPEQRDEPAAEPAPHASR
jgi:hypothetical protein